MRLTYEPSKGGKIALFTDGEYLMTADPDLWYSLGYSDGDEIDEEGLGELKALIGARMAYAQALRFLTLRAHSAQELYMKLTKKHSEESAAAAVERCRELGFIDDEDFAARYALELAQKKNYGISRIRMELISKGIDRTAAENAIKGLDIDFSSCIIEVINKKYSQSLGDEKGRRKVIAALMRLGHSYGEVNAALREYGMAEEENNEY